MNSKASRVSHLILWWSAESLPRKVTWLPSSLTNPVGVTAQIAYYLFRIFQWRPTVNHTRLMIKIRDQSFESRGFLQFIDLSTKLQFPSLILPFQPIQEFPSIQGGEHSHRSTVVTFLCSLSHVPPESSSADCQYPKASSEGLLR